MISDLEALEVGEELIDPVSEAELAWLELRRGKITCSRFGEIIGTGRGKDDVFTKSGMSYLMRVASERLGSWYSVSARAMEWGKDNEAAAIAVYQDRTGLVVDSEPFRFIQWGDWVGGTPDGLVGDDGCVEVKCPFDPGVHFNTLLTRKVPSEYAWQVDGELLVTGRKWCDFISFDPRIQEPRQMVTIRVFRNNDRIKFLKDRLSLACDEVDKMIQMVGNAFGAIKDDAVAAAEAIGVTL